MARRKDPGAAVDNRGVEHPDAQKVRDGELSAAQLGSHAGANEDYPDAIYPPGHVETAASAHALKDTEPPA